MFVVLFSRWLRLLFGREFPLDGLLVVWDAIFAYSPSLSLVDYICVAMLQFIRNIRKMAIVHCQSVRCQ